jgi:renalase
MARVAVVGAGISGAACAQALRDRGVTVDVIDRGRACGGRMASPLVHGRRVDVGAAYFTSKDDDFGATVARWTTQGLVRPWTDTFDVYSAKGHGRSSGPMRYAAPDGLRSLVRASLTDDVRYGDAVDSLDDLDHDAVVLAMPDSQAARLAPEAADWVVYEPVIAIVVGWSQRSWPIADAAFINDNPALSLIADDGARRGDGAPVLVAHTTSDLARAHLDAPDAAVAPVLAELRHLLDLDADPVWTHAHRWTFAKPAGTHGSEGFGLITSGGRPLGLCGDSWCPSGAPRVESAWLSGRALGVALAQQLGSGTNGYPRGVQN